jgi:hypothetical protein
MSFTMQVDLRNEAANALKESAEKCIAIFKLPGQVMQRNIERRSA